MSTYFEHIGPRARIQKVLNVLVEGPFFYQRDDPDLFAFLRRNRAEFDRFYNEMFGWQLVVDGRCARLYKGRWHNRALKPSQHDVFDLTRRDECIAFLLVLEFYEHLLDERNATVDDPEPLRFEFGELFAFARSRLSEVLVDLAPTDVDVRKSLRALMPILLRYRFLRELEPEPELRGTIEDDNLIYECLPALHQYDVRVLGENVVATAYGRADNPSDRDDVQCATTDDSDTAEEEP